MKPTILLAFCLLGSIGFAGIVGCDSSKGSGSTTTAPAPDVDKGKRFVATLKAMSPEKRQAYAAQHQDEVQNISRASDPTLMSEFTSLMRPPTPR